jgi:hypothetical protein
VVIATGLAPGLRATSTRRDRYSAAGRSRSALADAWSDFAQTCGGGDDPQRRAYDLLELFRAVASLVTSVLLWRRDKALTCTGWRPSR